MALSYPTSVCYKSVTCLRDMRQGPSFKRTVKRIGKRIVKIHLSRFYVETEHDYFFGLDISRTISLIDPLVQTSYWRCPLSASPLEQGHSPAAGNRRRLFHPDSLPAEDANRWGRPRAAPTGRKAHGMLLSRTLASAAHLRMAVQLALICSRTLASRGGLRTAGETSYVRAPTLDRSPPIPTGPACFPRLFGYRSAVPAQRCTFFDIFLNE